MFIKKLHNNRRKIALAIMAAFSVVFACNFLCDLGFINRDLTHDESHVHENVAADHHQSEQNHHHDFDEAAPDPAPHHQDGEEEEDCCEEETSQFYAILVKHKAPQFDLDQALVLFAQPWSADLTIKFSHKVINPHRLKSSLSPPSGVFACILFQSFLC